MISPSWYAKYKRLRSAKEGPPNEQREGFDWFEARCRNLLETPAGFWLYNPLNQSIDWILKIG